MKLLFTCLVVAVLNCNGQTIVRQSISSSGSSTSNDGVTIRQTIGQPYQTKTQQSGNTVLRPGFQQPVFSTELISSTIHISLVPNPALYSFYIETSDTLYHAVLSAYDEAGRLVCDEKMDVFKKHEVDCSRWANGVFVVNVTDKKGNLISAKLIKHE